MSLDAELDRLFAGDDTAATSKRDAATSRLRDAISAFVQEERELLPDQSHEAIRELATTLGVALSHMTDAISGERDGHPLAELRGTVTDLAATMRDLRADVARLGALIEAPRVRELVRDDKGRVVAATDRIKS